MERVSWEMIINNNITSDNHVKKFIISEIMKALEESNNKKAIRPGNIPIYLIKKFTKNPDNWTCRRTTEQMNARRRSSQIIPKLQTDECNEKAVCSCIEEVNRRCPRRDWRA